MKRLPWTKNQIVIARRLFAEGASAREIGEALGSTLGKDAIHYRLKALGLSRPRGKAHRGEPLTVNTDYRRGPRVRRVISNSSPSALGQRPGQKNGRQEPRPAAQ